LHTFTVSFWKAGQRAKSEYPLKEKSTALRAAGMTLYNYDPNMEKKNAHIFT
jgi:predicted lipoprotein with Yx(FWY)xxD motif